MIGETKCEGRQRCTSQKWMEVQKPVEILWKSLNIPCWHSSSLHYLDSFHISSSSWCFPLSFVRLSGCWPSILFSQKCPNYLLAHDSHRPPLSLLRHSRMKKWHSKSSPTRLFERGLVTRWLLATLIGMYHMFSTNETTDDFTFISFKKKFISCSYLNLKICDIPNTF